MTKNRRHDIVKPSKFKTSMCTFFLSAEGCPFGDKCAFAHGEDELRPDPRENAAATTATTTAEAAASTSPPTSSHGSDQGDTTAGASTDKATSATRHSDANSPNAAGNAKRRGKKSRMEASTTSATAASLRGPSAGKGETAQTRCRPQRDRRTMPPPPPMQSQGPMPSAAYNLSVAPPHPAAYAIYGDLSMAYGGLPGMSGMPYYIPTVGNHPFSNINNNQHAVNVVPHMASPIPFSAMAPPPPSFPPPPTAASPTPRSSMPSSPSPLTNTTAPHATQTSNGGTVNGAQAINAVGGGGGGGGVTSALPSAVAGEDGKRRPRQPMRHVVSSNTMAHSHGRHNAHTASAPPAEVASPQYVYGLMAAAGVPLTGSPMPTATTSDRLSSGGTPAAPPTAAQAAPQQPSQQQQQPRLIVVPHKSGSGGFVVPSNVKNYHPQSNTPAATPPAAEAATNLHSPTTSPNHGSTVHTSTINSPAVTTPATGSGAAAAAATTNPFQQLHTSPAPPTIVHIPLNQSASETSGSGSGGHKTMGDALWGPAGGPVNPLTASALPKRGDETGGEYNALLSGLGIGGSSYTTIPLEELLGHQRGATRDDDDVSVGNDFDWTGALERWLHTAKEEAATTTTTSNKTAEKSAAPMTHNAAATAAPAAAPALSTASPASSANTSAAMTTTYHPPGSQPVTSALNHTPVLMEGDAKVKTAAEGKRKPTVVCQVSRAGGKPVPPKRRGPVMTNQFKSSCAAAEADSGSVLLYCAEKNTLVYITSAKEAKEVAAAAAVSGTLNNTSLTASTKSNGESDGVPAAAHDEAAAGEPGTSPESPNAAAASLGLDVRFNPGRKKRSVLEPEVGDDETEYCI